MSMKGFLLIILILLAAGLILFKPKITGNAAQNIVREDITVRSYFCPQEHCQEKIISLINSSTDIKCAFYQLNLPEMIDMLRQKNADVVLENDNALPYFKTGYSEAQMHDKFCIFDSKTVLTGSFNPTGDSNFYNDNNIVIIESNTLAKNYLDEFSELSKNIFSGGETVKNPLVSGANGLVIENYFCPEDNCKAHVIDALDSANSTIYFMIYSFTDEDIGNLLWNKHSQGIDVQGIMDESQMSDYSRYKDLKDFAIIDYNPKLLHHKVFIIDNKTVITGSYNPTQNGNEHNDENIVIIHDVETANRFIEEFRTLQKPPELPRSPSGLIISEILYDSPGADTGKEYAIIKNAGESEIDLSYYSLSDNETSYRLNGTLSPGQAKRFYPKFTLKNTNGLLLLKTSYWVIDYVAWKGIWNLSANPGQYLKRVDETRIGEKAWAVQG